MNLNPNVLNTIKQIIKKSEEQLTQGKNYIPYYDNYFEEKSYTYISNFFTVDKKNEHDSENFFYQQKNKPEFMAEYLVPIASIGNGDFLCLDQREKLLPVYYWCHELSEKNLYIISKTFTDFPQVFITKDSVKI